jgi:predicted ATPase
MVIPQTPSLVLVSYRPEYEGALTRVHGAQTIALAPLSDSETATLITELLGPDPSVGALGQTIAQRAAGNPFFAEEIVRELAGRGVLRGQPGAYMSSMEGAEVSVPATLQATIAARIDRLDPAAKQTLCAASVIGSRFGVDLLTVLGIEPPPPRVSQGRTDRPGPVHAGRRVRIPPSAGSRGGLRITAEVGSRRVAPAAGRSDRGA